ncbi:unnamed protein product, partial [Rotaria magnacalcarata]
MSIVVKDTPIPIPTNSDQPQKLKLLKIGIHASLFPNRHEG